MSEETPQPELTPADIALAIADVLGMLDRLKPKNNSRSDWHYMIAINDLEHVLAYVDRWIVFEEKTGL